MWKEWADCLSKFYKRLQCKYKKKFRNILCGIRDIFCDTFFRHFIQKKFTQSITYPFISIVHILFFLQKLIKTKYFTQKKQNSLINFAKSDNMKNTKDNPRMQDKNKNKNKVKIIYKSNKTVRGIDGNVIDKTRYAYFVLHISTFNK